MNSIKNELNQPFQSNRPHIFDFTGEGARYFGIWATNIILTILTLGVYYPWAKAATRKFMWNETTLDGDRFVFHGTGKEMFRGFIIAYAVFAALIALIFIFPLGLLLFYLGMALLAPIAIFGGWRYRMSRTSYRGIYFSFRGNLSEFLQLYFVNLLLTIITLGIYGFWMRVKIMKYLFGHTQLGNYKLEFVGEGGELFGINVGGYFMTIFSFGIYSFWWAANRFNFTFRNIVINHDEGRHRMLTNLTGAEVLKISIVNILMLMCTLGIAFPWVIMRTLKMYMDSIAIPHEVDLNALQQDADNYKDATGDDLMDILDVGLEF